MQRRFLDAHLGWWDPSLPGFDDAANPVSPVYGGRMVEPSAIHLWTWDARPYPAFPVRADIWRDGDNWRRGHWLTGRLGKAPVDALIRRLLADHGFTDVDVSGVDAMVGGYLVGGPGTARAELEELMRLTGVVCHADGGRLVFRSLANLPAARTIEVFAEEAEGPLVEFRRREASEIPDEVVVGFADPGRDYQPAAAEALLALAENPIQETIELPVTLEESEARRFAAGLLADLLGGRETARFSLSPAEIAVEPGDVLALADVPGRWLVSRIEAGATRRLEARRLPEISERGDDRAVTPAPLPTGPVVASMPVAHFLDLPLGPDGSVDAAARLAVHARPYVPLIVEAAAPGGRFVQRLVHRAPSTLGTLASPLAPGPEGRLDRATALVVDLARGALVSVSADALLGGENLVAVLCVNGAWEVLQFQTAEEVAPMRFRLTGLLRAQGGTEDAMAAGAAAGSAFVLLDAGTSALGLRADEIGRVLDWRLVPAGRPLDDPAVLTRSVALGARAVRPLSPVHLRGRFAADGSLGIDWTRRTRTGGDGWDGLDVPLGEEIERFRTVLADGSGAELALETAAPAALVSGAAQIAAFGALPAVLTVRVAQLSLAYGAGTERQVVLVRPA